MAGDWIKFEIATSDKQEVWAMAQNLGIDADAVVGKLLRVWAWFDQQTQDGNAIGNGASVTTGVTKALLDRRVGVTGFCDAMIEVGWMVDDGKGVSLPKFDIHNGKTAKSRILTAKRVAAHKAKGNGVSVTTGVSVALPKEEKSTEEKKDISHACENSSGGGSEVMIPKELADLWPKWTQHHLIKTGQPIGEPQQEAILLDLAKRGWDKARADILFSMRIGASTVRDSENDFDKNAKKSASSKPEPKKEKELPMITELPPEIVAIYTRQAEERRKRNEEFERKRHDESVRRSVDMRDTEKAV